MSKVTSGKFWRTVVSALGIVRKVSASDKVIEKAAEPGDRIIPAIKGLDKEGRQCRRPRNGWRLGERVKSSVSEDAGEHAAG